jgi:hypothetical protein
VDDIAEGFKRCAKCRHIFPVDQFRYDGRTVDRLSYRCIECLKLIGPKSRRPMP